MFESIKIDTFSRTDFDKIIDFLSGEEVTVRRSNRPDMVIVAEMSLKLAEAMADTINTENVILFEPA